MMAKVCTKCGNIKAFTEFRKQSSTKDGLKYTCKECDNLAQAKRYDKKREEILKHNKEWNKSHYKAKK